MPSTKRVIYHDFTNEYFIKVVNYLYKNYEWEPIFMSGENPEQVQNKIYERY